MTLLETTPREIRPIQTSLGPELVDLEQATDLATEIRDKLVSEVSNQDMVAKIQLSLMQTNHRITMIKKN
jgi:hypothetical protein